MMKIFLAVLLGLMVVGIRELKLFNMLIII